MIQDFDSVYTVNSVSGGKTSGFMHLNYPTDVSVFALVKSSHPSNHIKDPGILAEVQRRCPGAVGSMELEATLKAILELEQLSGREIKWVSSEWSFEELVMANTDIPGYRTSPRLPDTSHRFCTQWLKLYPIWQHCYFERSGLPIMNIGFRADESKRVEKQDRCDSLNHIKAPLFCRIKNGQWQWQRICWREVRFPLYQDGVTKDHINEAMAKTAIKFPSVSNCAYCPFHLVSEHRKQYQENPRQLEAWTDLEQAVSAHHGRRATFHKNHSVADAAKGKPVEDWGPLFSCACTD